MPHSQEIPPHPQHFVAPSMEHSIGAVEHSSPIQGTYGHGHATQGPRIDPVQITAVLSSQGHYQRQLPIHTTVKFENTAGVVKFENNTGTELVAPKEESTDEKDPESKKKAKIRHQVKMRTRKYRERLKAVQGLQKDIKKIQQTSAEEQKMQELLEEQLQIVKHADFSTQRLGMLKVYNDIFKLGVDMTKSDLYKRQLQFCNVFFDKNVTNVRGGYSGLTKHLQLGMYFATIFTSITQRLKSMYCMGDHVICYVEFKFELSRTSLQNLYPHLYMRAADGSYVPKPEHMDLLNRMQFSELKVDYRQDFMFRGGKAVSVEVETDFYRAWLNILKSLPDVMTITQPDKCATKQLTDGSSDGQGQSFSTGANEIKAAVQNYARGDI